MKIIRPIFNGFCIGVRSAIELAKKNVGKNVFILGEIVHNSRVVKSLEEKGIKTIESVSKLKKGDTLIIPAHGAGKNIYDYCKSNEIIVVDATCEFVKKVQSIAAEKFAEGWQIILFGEKNHSEIIGVNGWCNNSAIISDGNDLLDVRGKGNIFILYQTTFSIENTEKTLENLIKDDAQMLEIFNTICYTTCERQKFASDLSKQCDTILVIGGKSSSNTRRLFEICKKDCDNTFLISEPDEMQYFNFSNTKCLGVIAGASTPDELTEEVLSVMVEKTNKESANITTEDSELFKHAVNKLPEKRKVLRKGQKLKGIIQHIDNAGVTVNFDFSKREGFIPNEEMAADGDFESAKAQLKIGEKIEVIIVSSEKELVLSKKQVDDLYKDDELVEGIKNGAEFNLTFHKEVKGGLLGRLGSYTVFVPSSQIRAGFVRDLSKYIGKELRLKALPEGVDDSKKKIVASQRLILETEKKAWEDNFWGNIEEGEIVEGKVLRFAPFGAFINVRGFDCLAHLSDISWTAIKNPGDVLELNKVYEFVVLKIDRTANRISVGYKQLQPDPWQVAFEKFPVGSNTQGKVVRILPFGAFVEIAPGIDGLLHVSNLTWEWVEDIKKVISVGDMVDVKVVEFIPETKRVTLSRKATMTPPPEGSIKNNDESSTEAGE